MSDSFNDSPPAHPLVGTSPGAPAQSSPPKRNEEDASIPHDSNDNTASLTSNSNGSDGLEAPPIGAKASGEEAARKFCRDVLLPASLGGEATTALSQARDALASNFSTEFDSANKPLRAVIAQTNKLWNKGKEPIFYVFLEGSDSGNEIQRNKVRTTIKEWENYGSFRFKEVTDPTWSATLGSQVIRITFYDKPSGPNAGSWSTIGTDCKTVPMNKPTMNYGWIHGNDPRVTAEEKAVILHEFGHALGMLHEHQSMAGGGIPIQNIKEAIRYYHAYNNWDDATIMQQAVNTYNLKDVSSFSKVDRTSIMHYPQPASVTGLPYDIPYQYNLSDMDKAYMRIMYPANDPTTATEQQLQAALVTVGIVKDDPATADKIRQLSKAADANGVVDPSQIRDLFSAWCRRAIAVTVTNSNGMPNGGAHNGLQAPKPVPTPAPPSPSQPILITKGPMCETEEDPGSPLPKPAPAAPGKTPSNKVKDALPGVLRAVNRVSAIDRRWKLDAVEVKPASKAFTAAATFSFAPCPVSKAKPTEFIQPSEYRMKLVQAAFLEWSKSASITFTGIAHPADNAPAIDGLKHCVIVFQDTHYGTGNHFAFNDADYRSYAQQKTSAPEAPSDASDANAMKRYEAKVPRKHTICYRGIVETAEEGAQPAPDIIQVVPGKVVTKEMHSLRTLIHEIGHWLGLSHEAVGAYGAFVFDDAHQKNQDDFKALAKTYRATKIDTGSVMDELTENDVIEEWKKDNSPLVCFRTSHLPSPVDIANISLVHPGKALTSALIDQYAKTLDYQADAATSLKALFEAGDLAKVRELHLHLIEIQSQDWLSHLSKDVDEEVKKILAKKLNASPPPRPPVLRADPSPSAGGNPSDTPSPKFNVGLLKSVYDALNNAFGPQGEQFLTLQFPTRYLSKDEYAFDLDGVYSNFVKPVTVAEAEARLVDAMYDPVPIVGGPNGKTLSQVYGQAINNLVPRYEAADRPAREQRERMRAWLLTGTDDQNPYYKLEVNTSTGGGADPSMSEAANKALLASNTVKMRKMTRMEFANQLTQDYLDAQVAWELEREGYINKAITTRNQTELENVTRKLVHVTAAQQNRLSMKYADAVVRGYSHVVREALGQLDVTTTAEALQDAKDSFRATAVSSLYSASKVLPVVMSPVDWALSLDTSFTVEDVADSPDVIIMQIQNKAAQLDAYKNQLSLLQGAVDGDPATLKAAVDAAARNLDKAESNLNSRYLDSTIELAKMVINYSTGGAAAVVSKVADMTKELDGGVKKLDPNGSTDDIKAQLGNVGDAQRALQQATSVYASQSAALARAEATDTRTAQANIQRNIDSLVQEIADLRAKLSAANDSANKLKALNDAHPDGLKVDDLAAATVTKTPGGSRWQSVIVSRKMKFTRDDSKTTTDFSRTSWSCDFWIASGGSDEKSSSDATTSHQEDELDVEITMQVTNVTIDRSGWFSPQILENSDGFMQNNSNYKFSTYPKGAEGLETGALAKRIREDLEPPIFPSDCPLPCYPVGMLICKDITIKVSNMSLSSETEKKHFLEKSQSSGGLFCFHYSRSSEHQEDSSHATFNFANDGMIVKIPGPQILGYIQQLVPQDRSTAFDPAKSLASEFYLPPPLNKDLAKNTDTPAATSGTPGGSGANTLKTSNPTTASVPPAGFAFEVGKTKMSADDSEMTSGNTEAPKGGSLRGLEAPATKGQSAHPPRDAALDDVFKNIVDTLQGNDEALKAAVKKWLDAANTAPVVNGTM